jgi:transposase-like protein
VQQRPAQPAFTPGCHRVPDGRTVLTEPEALNSCNDPVSRTQRHLPPFIPDTNSIEALHRQIRKIIKTRGHFPTEDAARKLLYLAITKAETKWRQVFQWHSALAAFKIQFPDRIPDNDI